MQYEHERPRHGRSRQHERPITWDLTIDDVDTIETQSIWPWWIGCVSQCGFFSWAMQSYMGTMRFVLSTCFGMQNVVSRRSRYWQIIALEFCLCSECLVNEIAFLQNIVSIDIWNVVSSETIWRVCTLLRGTTSTTTSCCHFLLLLVLLFPLTLAASTPNTALHPPE